MSKKYKLFFSLISIGLILLAESVKAQSEVTAWGNITGIRKSGQLFEFETSLRVVSMNGLRTVATALEKQRPKFNRSGNKQLIITNIDSLHFNETVEDRGTGKLEATVKLAARKDTDIRGVYFCINLPAAVYSAASVRLTGAPSDSMKQAMPIAQYGSAEARARGIDVNTAHRTFSIRFDDLTPVIIKKDTAPGSSDYQIYLPIVRNGVHKGDSVQKSYRIKVSGDIDRAPASLTVNTAQTGRPFEGLGGNFRLQNPKTDPQVIDYCLDNLRVAYGRVEMPWRFWQPEKDTDPTEAAKAGKIHPAVVKAMEMAQRLNKTGMPVILTAWFPPAWAAVGKLNYRPVNGIWGNPLNHDNMELIYKSITDYILYLKANYGTEVSLFSFNESDLGINIRVTAGEHDEFIKGLGAYFASKGLKTKMLLGDNSDATTYQFIYPALNDPAALPYIGAISFHSWRGWSTELLEKWADAATKVNLPLLVGEGSIDAAASAYPQIFQEPIYALQEINLYTRLLAICQPASILQWQLTADYSPLIGGGIFGNNEPLHPGQRFWNLKQLSSTPPHLFAMPITSSNPVITCAALGDNDKGIYTLHLVNNGAKREVTITGLPATITSFKLYTTNKKLSMETGKVRRATKGGLKFKLEAASYVTLIASK